MPAGRDKPGAAEAVVAHRLPRGSPDAPPDPPRDAQPEHLPAPFALSLIEIVLALVLVPLATAAWIALATAEIGRFSPVAAAIGAGLALGALGSGWVWGWRQRRLRFDGAAGWDLAALALVAVAMAWAWPANTPWPAFLDATWYVNTAARIARDGSLTFHPEALAVADPRAQQALIATFADERAVGLPFPADSSRGFHAVVFSAQDVGAAAGTGPEPPLAQPGAGSVPAASPVVHPYHPPFFATSLALAARDRGLGRIGEGALPWALAYLVAVAALARAAFGTRVAWLAVIVVGAGPAFSYFGANPYAEPAAGALALAGLVCLVRLVSWGGAGDSPGTAAGARVLPPETPEPDDPHPLLAAAAGLGLGLAGLVKVDLWPVALVGILWWWLARRRVGAWRESAALGIGIGLPAAQFAILALTVSNLYVRLNGGGVIDRLWSWAPAIAAAGLALALTAVGWIRWQATQGAVRRSAAGAAQGRDGRGRMGSGGADQAAGGRAVEGWAQALTGRDARRVVAIVVVLALGAAMVAGWLAPADRPPSMVTILAWLVTPLGLWAAALGLVLALEGEDPRAGPIIALALTVVPLLLVDPVVSRSLSSLYTARRLVPIALPLVAVLAAAGTLGAVDGLRVAWRREDQGGRVGRAPTLAGAALLGGAGALVVAGLILAAAPFAGAKGRDFAGGAAITRRLAAYGGPRDVLLFASTLDGDHAGRLAAAVWALEDRPTAVVGSPEPDGAAIAAAVDAWRAQGRRVFTIDDGDGTAAELPGYTAIEAGRESLVTQVLAPSPELPPRLAPLALDFRVSELEPAGP